MNLNRRSSSKATYSRRKSSQAIRSTIAVITSFEVKKISRACTANENQLEKWAGPKIRRQNFFHLSREHCLELVELIELVEMLDTRYLPPSRCRSACCTLLLQCQLLFYHVIPGLSSFPLHILFQLDDIVPVERDNQDIRKILNRRKIKLQKSDSPASHSGMANKFHYCMIRVRAGGGGGQGKLQSPSYGNYGIFWAKRT